MRGKGIIEKTYSNKLLRIGLHLLFWTFVFASNYYLSTISFNSIKNSSANFLLSAKNTIIAAIFFYTFVYFVFPRLFLGKKYLLGTLATVVLVMIYAFIDAVGDKQIINNCKDCVDQLLKDDPQTRQFLQLAAWNIGLTKLASLGLLYQLWIRLSLPVAIKIGRSYFRQTVQQLQLSKENLQLEFNFLKAQVNPHFLFNTLNNIYSLVVHDKKEEATSMIARLSGFMRYTLYDCNEDKIQLEKEINLLKDYIELEKIRLNQTKVEFSYTSDRSDYLIPPLLFMPAVENAFKYVADNSRPSNIDIDITVAEGRLRLSIQNNSDPQKTGSHNGIGIQNMKKRLEHHYPESHTYNITVKDNNYLMELTCVLS
jgi:Histidine kinase